MIVVEERIFEVLKHLPEIDSLKPVYAWGDEKHLNKWIKAKNEANENNYPLIYQTSKTEVQNVLNNTVSTTWKAVIAMNNENVDLFNTERWELAFKNYLNPLADMVTKGFQTANFQIKDGEIEIERYGNYGEGDEHWTLDKWDAITYQCELTIHGYKICSNQLIFE